VAAWLIATTGLLATFRSLIANPLYAITIDEGLALPHEPRISENDWIKANVGLIKDVGPEPYLPNLLSVLKGNYPRG
jgi:hypothetical protein